MAEVYDYRQAVIEAVRDYLRENPELKEKDESELNDILWTEDSVTGNASGSYWCNSWKAEECLAHNWGEIEKVAEEFGLDAKISDEWEYGAEWWDVTIRCYYLGEAISEVLGEDTEEEEEED